MDTSEKVHREMVKLLRAKSPEWKIRQVFALNALAKKMEKVTAEFRSATSRELPLSGQDDPTHDHALGQKENDQGGQRR